MEILVIGLAAALGLLVVSRYLGSRETRALKQYEDLAKRFRLERRTHRSPWGKGIGERYSLHGEYRGYPISIYGHYRKERGQPRQDWTSLTMEALFADDMEILATFAGSQGAAAFPEPLGLQNWPVGERSVRWRINRPESDLPRLMTEAVDRRLDGFDEKAECGALRLSKGFFEYREAGPMEEDAMRIRFQEALLLLGELADAVSIYAARERGREA